MTDRPLDAREAIFVQEYLIDLDVTRAALKAGYSSSMANTKVFQWVRDGKAKPHVFAAVQAAMDQRAKRTQITADRVLKELGRIAFANLSDVVSWGSREVAFGYDDEGRKLAPQDIGDAVLVQREMAPFVDALNSTDLSDAAKAAVSEVALTKDGLKIKMHDKNAALASIGRHLGMFNDKLALSGGLTVEVVRFADDDPPTQ